MTAPTVDELHRRFEFDPDTGAFTWKEGRCAGRVAGTRYPHGYTRLNVRGHMLYAHRVVWLFTHGAWPSGDIDHIDGDRNNDRPENLRDGSKCSNLQNLKRAFCTNHSGSSVPGVYFRARQNAYVAELKILGVPRRKKQFPTLAEAEAQMLVWRREHMPGNLL